MHLFDRAAIMITTSNSSSEERGAHSIARVLLHTMAISGLSRVRTELDPLLIIPSLAHHPVQTNCQPTRHGDEPFLSCESFGGTARRRIAFFSLC